MPNAQRNPSELRLLIADDHELLLRGLRTLLEAQPGWKVVAEARDGHEAVEKAVELRPDIAILDICMPRLNGLDAACRILKMLSTTKVLFLTMHESEHLVREALKTGAQGYITKSDGAEDLLLAVQALRRGETFFTQGLNQMVLENYVHAKARGTGGRVRSEELTPRQREVVQLLSEGKSSKQISVLLDLSTKTVDSHRAQIMARVGCHSVSDLVRYAIRNNIIRA